MKKWIIDYREQVKQFTGHPFPSLMAWRRRGQFRAWSAEASALLAKGYVLEIGSGYGYMLKGFVKQAPGIELMAVDVSSVMLDRAVQRVEKAGGQGRVTYMCSSIESAELPENHFDLAVSAYSLHLWTDKLAGLKIVLNSLKPGAEFRIRVGIAGRLETWKATRWLFPSKFPSMVEMSELIAGAGFELRSVRPMRVKWSHNRYDFIAVRPVG